MKAKVPGFVEAIEQTREFRVQSWRKIMTIYLVIKRRKRYFIIIAFFTCAVFAILAWIKFCKKGKNKKK